MRVIYRHWLTDSRYYIGWRTKPRRPMAYRIAQGRSCERTRAYDPPTGYFRD